LRSSEGNLTENTRDAIKQITLSLTQSLSYRKLTFFFLSWCTCWIVLQTIALQWTFEFGWYVSLIDAAMTNIVIAVAGYDLILVMKYYRPAHYVVRLAMSIGLTFICVFAMHHLTLLVVDETPEYVSFLDKSLLIRGLYVWLMIALVSALTGLWLTALEQQEARNRSAAAEKLAREAELSRLRQQLQPHFLFNSLNSVSALAGSRPEEARKMIHQLSDFFRGTLKKDDQQLIPLSEELEHLTLYLDIEKVRFGHRLKTEIDCDDAPLAMKLPSLLLQPVVENAIKFGLYDTLGETVIRISARAESNYLEIAVENPFDPSSAPPKHGTGFGLNSIERRLYLLYARNDLLKTSHKENTFTTTIRIPQSA
jgi:two-component system, LytTR family, sensor kinase